MESCVLHGEIPKAADAPASPLMALPCEIRLQIYEELLYPARFPQLIKHSKRLCRRHSAERAVALRELEKRLEMAAAKRELEERYCDREKGNDGGSPFIDSKKTTNEDGVNESDHDATLANRDHYQSTPNDRGVANAQVETRNRSDSISGGGPVNGSRVGFETMDGLTSYFERPSDPYGDCECYSMERVGYDPLWGNGWDSARFEFGVDPAILRVNKQIYNEAVPLLYKNASCRISLEGGYKGELLSQVFHRSDSHDLGRLVTEMNPVASWGMRYWMGPSAKKDMHLDCLRYMPEISIVFSWSDMFANPEYSPAYRAWRQGGSTWSIFENAKSSKMYFTEEGEFILELLRYLDENPGPTTSRPKRLNIKFDNEAPLESLLARFNELPVCAEDNLRDVLDGLQRLIALLRRLSANRILSIEEYYWVDYQERDQLGERGQFVTSAVYLGRLAWIESRQSELNIRPATPETQGSEELSAVRSNRPASSESSTDICTGPVHQEALPPTRPFRTSTSADVRPERPLRRLLRACSQKLKKCFRSLRRQKQG